ncbi:MAG TPA: polyphenol oxidase family protein [Ktedonobacterales bacterium]
MIEAEDQGCVYFRFEGLKDAPEVAHAVFTRLGGHSQPPFDELNLSASTGDDPEIVRRNRAIASATLGLPLVSAKPVHGGEVVIIDRDLTGSTHEDGWHERLRDRLRFIEADAMVTDIPGVALFWAYGDCSPILIYDPAHHAIALAHAGWRGAAAAVTRNTLRAMARRYGTRPEEVLASIGPSIGACCYQVDDRVLASFAASPLGAGTEVIEWRTDERGVPRAYLDVPLTSEAQLLAEGVLRERIELSGFCTGCGPDLFYSNRKGPRHGGRFGVAIGLREVRDG